MENLPEPHDGRVAVALCTPEHRELDGGDLYRARQCDEPEARCDVSQNRPRHGHQEICPREERRRQHEMRKVRPRPA